MSNEIAALPSVFWFVAIALFGLVIGSFLNVVIHRLPRGESIVLPASHCGACNTPIKTYDNLPLLSYILLGGRCRSCRKPISLRYPAVEALTALLFVAAYVARGTIGLAFVFDCIFIALIIPLVFIDADRQILPAKITHPGLLFALVARIFAPNLFGMSPDRFGAAYMLGLADGPDWYVSLVGAAAGGLLGGGGLFLIGLLYEIIRKEEGLGLGDVSMMCFVGAYLGWELTLVTVMLGSLIGSLIGIGLMLMKGRTLKLKLPFGVFLGAGAVTSLLVGTRLILWYTSFFFRR